MTAFSYTLQMRRIRMAAPLCLALISLFLSPRAFADATDFFEAQIRPVLVERCYSCHSAQADPVKGEFLLDSLAGMVTGGASGVPAVVPGDAGASRLIDAISYQNDDLQMPPKDRLPDSVVVAFRKWIDDGAVFPAGDVPVDLMAKARAHWAFHAPEPQALPPVRDAAWPRTETDYFVLSRLEAAGLSPAPEADRRTLIRRLTFDLIGLPPTPEEVRDFVADADPAAYDKLVERLLASPHYGERWARHWLDVARYADTKGYVYGREEVAFVHGHVYRDWVVNALNADMPYDRFVRMQLAADTLTDEATRDDLAAMGFLTLGQRFLGVIPDIIDDRIDTVTRGLMGLTVSCARCHDHKFDPIPIEDYYSLYGVFSASSERTVPLHPGDLNVEKYSEFNAEFQARQKKLDDTFAEKSAALEVLLRAQVDRYLLAVPTVNNLPTDDFYEIRNNEDLNPTIVRRWAAHIAGRGTDDAIFGVWNRATVVAPENIATILASLDPATNPAILAALAATPCKTFEDVVAIYAQVFKSVNDEWIAAPNAPDRLPDDSREAIRQTMMANGSPIRVPQGAIVDLEWMFAEEARVEMAKLQAEIDRWIINAEAAPDFVVSLADKPEPPAPHVFQRGSPANPGEEVPRQFLALLSDGPQTPFADGSGRREMADAIASATNPLTARVMVNRVWGWHFGQGLVETPSDFGTRSAAPSHPELLDWLALHFVAHGWSLKELQRQIVLSATYRQASDAPDDNAREIDPENKLVWRFNRHRLDFESLRDALLFTSGEIDLSLGGRPVELVGSPFATRRTLYGRVDRRFLPSVFRVFDFPSPDTHSPQRLDTTVPQQALYLMNNPFVQEQARALAGRTETLDDNARVEEIFEATYQRAPNADETLQALDYVSRAAEITPPPPPQQEPSPWSYGYGTFDEATEAITGFTPLPYFTGTAWQGGPAWPDPALGWAQLTADGGHPGNDLSHAVVRRWTAPESGSVDIRGHLLHTPAEGDGIRARLVSSRLGSLGMWQVHATASDTNFYGIALEAGDTLDFVVDIGKGLNNDQHTWTVAIARAGESSHWESQAGFAGPQPDWAVPLTAWEKFAQVLLSSNEFLFVD